MWKCGPLQKNNKMRVFISRHLKTYKKGRALLNHAN